jgi:peptidyl-prolyl cis-trans isomerase D
MEAIFNAREKTQPTAVKIPQGYAVFQLLETKPASTPSFEDIKPRAESDFKAERAAALLSQKTQELSDRARAEHDLKKAASAVGATIKTSELVSPTSQLPDIGQMNGPASVAFAMKPGDISAPLNTGRGGVVLKIIEKQEPPSADFDKAKDQLRETLLERKRQERFSLFISDLRRRMEKEGKIRINQKEMNRITTPVGS